MAASAAVEWYEDARTAAGITAQYSPEIPANLIEYPKTTRVIEEAVAAIDQRGRAIAVKILQQRAKQLVTSAGRETGASLARRDPSEPRYARVPTGATTCAWCIMWAGRGFIYKNEETARFTRSHSDCDCQIVPSWSSNPLIRGYNPHGYEAMYQAAKEDLLLEGALGDEKSIAARIRMLFAKEASDGHPVPNASRDGTLQRHTLEADRKSAIAALKQQPKDREKRLIPPRAMTQAPQEWPEDLPEIRAMTLRHILYGTKGGGGHLHGYGWRFDGSEFPKSWDETHILQAAEELLRSGITPTGPKGAKLVGEYDGIKIAVVYSYDGVKRGKIKSIYPIRATR
nr:MAG TPA: minor capsid protein [Caudoviricetes sp.]